MHVIGDPIIDLDESKDVAHLDCYAVVYQLGEKALPQGDLTLGIRYSDDVVLHQGRWMFKSRTAQTLWMR